MRFTHPRFEGLIPGELLDAIRANRCILFVGAGLSAQVKRADGNPLPNWNQFLKELLDWSIARQVRFWGDPEDIRSMVESGDLLSAAQELQERLTVSDIAEFMNTVFRAPGVRPVAVHQILPKIPFRAILTTNYDTLIEGAYAAAASGRIPPVLTQLDLLARPSLLRRADFFIFKVHGHLDRPDSVVLGSRDYQQILFQTPGYRQFIETLFATHTVFFLGFGGQDPDLDNVLDRLAALYSRTLDRHFILLPQGRFNSTQKRRLALDRRLEVIEYLAGRTHSQVLAFLHELHRQISGGMTPVARTAKASAAPKVFISASLQDRLFVHRLVGHLREHGYVPWAAADEVEIGDDLRQRIGEALATADCVLVVFSENSEGSNWVRYEADAALIREVTDHTVVIPIVLGDVGDARLPPYFRNRAYIRLPFEYTADDLAPLIRALARVAKHRRQPPTPRHETRQ